MRLNNPERLRRGRISGSSFSSSFNMNRFSPSVRSHTILPAMLLLLAASGCATRGVTHNTAAYKDCVLSQAMDMLDSPGPAEDLAKVAAAQCQVNLALINEKLRQDNAWMERYGSNADGFTEKLRDRTSAEVAEEIREIRGR